MFWESIGIGLALALGGFAWYLHIRALRERILLSRLPEEASVETSEVAAPLPQVKPMTIPFIERATRRAGVSISPFDVILISLTTGLVGGLLAFELQPLEPITFLVGAIFAYLPILVLRIMATVRIRKLEAQLADAIDLMVAALQAGVSVRHSIELVHSEKKGPIRDEFRELTALMDVGVPGHQAFRQWAKPLGSKIVDAFSIAMAAKWDIGGNYSEMLKNLADRIRESIRLRRRVQTLTAEAKLTAVFALILPYALGIFLWAINRDHFKPLLEHPAGLTTLYIAIMMQLAAIIVIRRMIQSAVA
jgi:tight adherence protein B